jgi:hypothetical protein
VDVVFCGVEDAVVELELGGMVDVMVELEIVVLDPTGRLVLPSNSVSMPMEKMAIATTTTTIVNRFFARLVMGLFPVSDDCALMGNHYGGVEPWRHQ